jgi:hypothetical protein
VPRYDLPKATDGSEQWMDLKDRTDITRKELRAVRLAFDIDGGIVEKSEAHTEMVLAQCLTNWQIKTASGDSLGVPQKNIKQVQDFTAGLSMELWLAIEDAINGPDRNGGYTSECLRPIKDDGDPTPPSTG